MLSFSRLILEKILQLTDNDELDPDGVRAEPVDALADEDAGVVLVDVLDLEVALVGPDGIN